jgi:LysM repeat protein
MNNRFLSLPVLGLLVTGSVCLPVVLRADDMSASAPATNTTPAATAQPPLAQPAIVSPSPTASGDTASTPPAPAMGNPETYTVVTGDTLWGIAHKFNTSIKKIKKLNGLKKSNLKPGQVLKIPPASDASATGATK